MKADIDPPIFRQLGYFIIKAWENPQIRMLVAGQGLSQAHIDEVRRIMRQIDENPEK